MESVKEMIEKRAYHLFLKRNGAHGYHMQDWVQAEKEVRAELEAAKKGDSRSAASKTAPAPAPTTKSAAPAPVAASVAKPKIAVKGNKKR